MKRTMMKLVILLLATLSPLCAIADYDMTPPVGEAGPDVSAAYQELWERGPELSRDAFAGQKVVFVPGFIADQVEPIWGYFHDQAAYLNSLGLSEGRDFQILRHEYGFSGEKGVSNNAEAILSLLRTSDRPVLLVSHSKGSIDVLEALLREPAARAKVKGWISLQGAIAGSPIADSFSTGFTRELARILLGAYGGDISSLEDLRHAVRIDYLTRHLGEIHQLVRQIPVLGVSTRVKHSELSFDYLALSTFFEPNAADYTDGLVEIRDSLIPWVPFVQITGADHRVLTQGVADRLYRWRFTRTILTLFEHLSRKAN